MQIEIDKSPFFRKTMMPWYATHTACLIKSVIMLVFILFGADGIKVARQVPEYNDYVWVPVLLVALSGIVFAVNFIRVIRRYTENSET